MTRATLKKLDGLSTLVTYSQSANYISFKIPRIFKDSLVNYFQRLVENTVYHFSYQSQKLRICGHLLFPNDRN